MNKIIAMIISVFMFVVMVGMVSALPTAISGTVVDASNVAVNGASVAVTCTHLAVPTTKTVTTNSLGVYNAYFSSTECNSGDTAVAHTDGAADNTGKVDFNKNCRINTLKLNLQIPEFGVIAGAVALVGALGIFVYRRKN
jgi:hypothetical protein